MAATFETVSQQTTTFGNNSYVEVARKRLRDERGEKRWARFITLPANDELARWIAESIVRAFPSTQALIAKQ